jgi:hypothetical protein
VSQQADERLRHQGRTAGLCRKQAAGDRLKQFPALGRETATPVADVANAGQFGVEHGVSAILGEFEQPIRELARGIVA